MFFHFCFGPIYFYFFLLLLSININQFSTKTREGDSIHCFSMKNYTTILLFSFSFFARIFILHYISIGISYVFLSLFLVLMFFHFVFLPHIYIFLLFFNFLFFYFLFCINKFRKKTREKIYIRCFSMKNYTIIIFFLSFFHTTVIFNFSINVSQ
jgi:hypothetical protein